MPAAKCHNLSQQSESTSQKWLAEARRTGEQDSYRGKRNEPRVSWDVQVTIDVMEDGESAEALYANTRDISATGLGMRSRKPVPDHAIIRVTVDETGESVTARVVQCTQGICDYHIGVEFITETCSSSKPAAPVTGSHPVAGLRTTVYDRRLVKRLQSRAA